VTLNWMKVKLQDERVEVVVNAESCFGQDCHTSNWKEVTTYSDITPNGCHLLFNSSTIVPSPFTPEVGTIVFDRERRSKLDMDFQHLPVGKIHVQPLAMPVRNRTLAVDYSGGWELIVPTGSGETNSNNGSRIRFSDKQLATRFSKALIHAVSLCGGLKEEPF
jgi:hypothetical protein